MEDIQSAFKNVRANYEQSGISQSEEFWAWVGRMKQCEAVTEKKERVYLVISKLRRVAEGERKGVAGRLGSLRDSVPSSSKNSASLRSSGANRSMQSLDSRKEPSHRDKSRRKSDDSRDDLSDSSDDGELPLQWKKHLQNAVDLGANIFMSKFSRELTEHSDSASSPACSDSSTTQSSCQKRSRPRSRRRPRFTPRYPSPVGILPAKAFRSPNTGQRGDSRLSWRCIDSRTPSQSQFQGSKTAEQHWAVEVGGRYFELEVRKKVYGDGVKSFSRFTCRNIVGQTDKEITEKLYVGRTHMVHSVLREIGLGIMKTQPKYTLPSDNCQHFMAVYLPRILCHRHPHLTTIPNCSVELLHKFTTLPRYDIGIKAGLLTVVEHRYFRIASGVQHILSRFKDKGSQKSNFESTEVSRYTFQLQGDDPSHYGNCRTLRRNPYLVVHREFHKQERRPLGDCEEKSNEYWLWQVNRGVRKTTALSELALEQNIETAKGIWKSFQKTKMEWEAESEMKRLMVEEKQRD